MSSCYSFHILSNFTIFIAYLLSVVVRTCFSSSLYCLYFIILFLATHVVVHVVRCISLRFALLFRIYLYRHFSVFLFIRGAECDEREYRNVEDRSEKTLLGRKDRDEKRKEGVGRRN